MKKPILYLIINNHFDPMWRRCWDRRFTFNGNTFVSYADLEEYYLLDNLELARQNPEYKFEAEFSLVVQKFLERHPHRLEELRQLSREGRFAVTGGGQVIVDANMVLGESLVRNYLLGLLWVEETLGQKTRLAVRNDAFGNSAQLPQILRGCEIAWATGMSYSPAQGRYWRGLDGSIILHATLPDVASAGGITKYAPCPACRGDGRSGNGAVCDHCQGRGIASGEKAHLPGNIDRQKLEAAGAGRIVIGPEELLPNPELLDWARNQAGECDVRFALEEDLLPHLQPWLEAAGSLAAGQSLLPAEVHPGLELNPNNSGCWVTRIATKQAVRRLEYTLQGAEFLSVQAALGGAPYPHDRLAETWRRLLFAMFHDAITATHVDPAYEELRQVWQQVEDGACALRQEAVGRLASPDPDLVSVVNPTGAAATQVCAVRLPGPADSLSLVDDHGQVVPVLGVSRVGDDDAQVEFLAQEVPALGARAYRVVYGQRATALVRASQAKPVIENSRFRVEADEHGLCEIFDKRLGRVIVQAGEYRPGELVLEHDEGSPWATLDPDMSRTLLARSTLLEAVEAGSGIVQRLTFAIKAPFRAGYVSQGLQASLEVRLVEGLERVDFSLHVNWNTFNHRLRIAFPLPVSGRGFYAIPYGMIERQPYLPTFGWAGANGDWPAVNWAGVEATGLSVAIFNQGLPSYRIEPGRPQGDVVLLSVLRSPAIPTYLHEPEFYTMTLWDGMRDGGEHDFAFAIAAYGESFAGSPVTTDAESYNAGLLAFPGALRLAEMPVVRSGSARIAAVKMAEENSASPHSALVVRLVETRGQGGEVTVGLPDWAQSVAQVNLLERQAQPLPIEGGQVRLSLRPWEIATLKLSH